MIAAVVTFIAAHPILVMVTSVAVILVVVSDYRRIRRRGPRS